MAIALLSEDKGLELPGADDRRRALRLRAVRQGLIVSLIAFLLTQPLRHVAATARANGRDASSNAASSSPNAANPDTAIAALAAAVGAALLVTWGRGASPTRLKVDKHGGT